MSSVALAEVPTVNTVWSAPLWSEVSSVVRSAMADPCRPAGTARGNARRIAFKRLDAFDRHASTRRRGRGVRAQGIVGHSSWPLTQPKPSAPASPAERVR